VPVGGGKTLTYHVVAVNPASTDTENLEVADKSPEKA
jgi:hypothetical protein